MDRATCLLGGLGLGAGLMYFFDPQMGRRRRAQVGDQLTSLLSRADDALCCVGRDLGHRAQGLAAEAKSLVTSDNPDDRVVEDRVRSHLGRVVSHPRSIEVTARGGRVTLSGPILAHEVEDLLSCVSSVRGVQEVENRLEVHKQRGNIPSLQGGRTPPGETSLDVLQRNWAPATRVMVGAAGCGLMAWGLQQQFPVACLLGTAGLALAARAATNLPLAGLVGLDGGRAPIEVVKTVTINGPVERVFPFWADHASFPKFMSNVREVRDLGDGRSHWVVRGPTGISVSWNAVITAFEPNRLIAWRSEPGSAIANAGSLRFEDVGDGRTRVTVRLGYNPPGGALGHLAAWLFGADPKSEFDADLVRLKSLIEDGLTSAPGKGRVARQDVPAEPPVPALA